MTIPKSGDYNETRSGLSRPLLRLTRNSTSRGPFWEGDYVHRAGIVSVLREGPTPAWPNGYTRLDAVLDGRLVFRSWERAWSDRAIPKLARQLLELSA